jgi:Tfp pilus assembly protein PilZ
MPADEPSGARPGPVVLRIKLRYDDVDAMVTRFAPNVGKSGLFLPTKSLQPVGTEVKFELRIANDTPVLVGLGKVKAVREPNPNNPKAAFGMAIELMRVTREGREVIIRMIERRRAMGLADVAIPMPEDVEAAKRADVDTQPRGDVGGIVRNAMPQMASAPVA